VIVDVHLDGFPLDKVEGFVGQRFECRFLESFEQLGPGRFELPELAPVEPDEQFAYRLVQFGQTEECTVTQGSKNPPLQVARMKNLCYHFSRFR
jgi:hypothetical protein